MIRVQFLSGAMMGLSSLHYCVQAGFGTCPDSYPMGTMGKMAGV